MSRFAHLDTAEEILTASGLPAFEAAVLTFLEEHRGLPLIRSTARDLLEMLNAADRTLQREIDALAMNKMNVLHWHAVDADAFTLAMDAFPTLASRGADSPRGVYSVADQQAIVEYARQRGVRVLLETDVPGAQPPSQTP